MSMHSLRGLRWAAMEARPPVYHVTIELPLRRRLPVVRSIWTPRYLGYMALGARDLGYEIRTARWQRHVLEVWFRRAD